MHASVQRPGAALADGARRCAAAPAAAIAAQRGGRRWQPLTLLHITSSSSSSNNKICRIPLQPVCRPRKPRAMLLAARAQLPPAGSPPDHGIDNHGPAYLPYSAELLLATSRLGHLERYRDEVAALYQPGMPVELTRCALLISNIFSCQLDHRPYLDSLEQLLAAATLLIMQRIPDDGSSSSSSTTTTTTAGFAGLDVCDAGHVLVASRAISEVLFARQETGHTALALNEADPHDPLNSSIADVLDTGKGSPWALAVAWLHLAEGLGLPCSLVGSTSQLYIRVGDVPLLLANNNNNNNSSGPAPVFLVSMCQPGVVYAHPSGLHPAAAGGLQRADSLASSSSADLAATSEWSRSLNDFLRPHRGHHQLEDGDPYGDDDADLSAATASSTSSSMRLPSSSDADGDADSLSGARATEFSTPGGEDAFSSTSAWLELDAYAVQDAATRNSWKALYGPGALAEWGGSVRSLSSGSGSAAASSSMDAVVLPSPFAAAADLPFVDDSAAEAGGCGGAGAAAAAASLSRSASLDTQCSSSASMELDSFINSDADSTSSSGSGSGSSLVVEGAVLLTWADVGWLQPVSKRMLLQQLLADIKVPLMMSGRQEELLLVLRYLRATDPFSLPDLRDVALALAAERPEEAAPLLREYLAAAPGAVDADMVREVLVQVEMRVQLGRARGWSQSP